MKIAAGALAVIAVLIGWYAIDNRGEMNTRIEELTVELEAREAYITELTDTVTAKQVELDSLVKATADSVAAAGERAEGYIDGAREAKTKIDSAISALNISAAEKQSLYEEVRFMDQRYGYALAAKDSSIAMLRKLSRDQNAQIDRYISVNLELHVQVAAALALADEWKAKANPDFLSKLTRDPVEKVVFALAFVGVGAAISK